MSFKLFGSCGSPLFTATAIIFNLKRKAIQMTNEVDKMNMIIEDLEDLKVNIDELIAVPLIDLKKEIKNVNKILDNAIKEIKAQVKQKT